MGMKSITGKQSDRRPLRTVPARNLQCLWPTLSPSLILKASFGIILSNLFPCLRSTGHDSKFPLRALYISQSESAFSKHRHHIKPSNRCPLHRSWSRTNTVEKSNQETVQPSFPSGWAWLSHRKPTLGVYRVYEQVPSHAAGPTLPKVRYGALCTH